MKNILRALWRLVLLPAVPGITLAVFVASRVFPDDPRVRIIMAQVWRKNHKSPCKCCGSLDCGNPWTFEERFESMLKGINKEPLYDSEQIPALKVSHRSYFEQGEKS